MILRPAVEADAARLEEIRIRTWRAAYTGKADPSIFENLAPELHDLENVTVAEYAGEIAGYCVVAEPSRDADEPAGVAEVATLNVEPGHYRRGVGRALLGAAIARLREAGWNEATVWTLDDNHQSLPLYESFGFERDGASRTDAGWFVPDVRLRAKLKDQETQTGSESS